MKSFFRNADGSSFHIAIDGYDGAFDPWDSTVHVISPLDGRSPDIERTREFHIAARGNFDRFVASRFESTAYLAATQSNGELAVYISKDPWSQGFAVWRGRFHEYATYFPFSMATDMEYVMNYMNGLDVDDTPEGLQLAASATDTQVVVQATSTYVRSVGFMDLYSPAKGLSYLPSWSGAKTRAGEIWRVNAEDTSPDNLSLLVLASETAVICAEPRESLNQPAQRVVDFLSSVTQLEYRRN